MSHNKMIVRGSFPENDQLQLSFPRLIVSGPALTHPLGISLRACDWSIRLENARIGKQIQDFIKSICDNIQEIDTVVVYPRNIILTFLVGAEIASRVAKAVTEGFGPDYEVDWRDKPAHIVRRLAV